MTPEALIERIGRELAGRTPRRAEPATYDSRAAVTLLLRPAASTLEFLTIKRSESERDPWSGHMALPGGRQDPEDRDLWATAVRETYEEVGVDLLEVGRWLGQLDDVVPGTRSIPAIAITPFVVAVGGGVSARTSPEVQYAVWLPIEIIVDARHRGHLKLEVMPEVEFPTIDYEGHVIWGLTLRILGQVEEVLRAVGYRPGREE